MSKERLKNIDPGEREEELRKHYVELERVEQEKNEAFLKMQQYASDLGCQPERINPSMRYLEFKTWQEALDFQAFCAEEFQFDTRVEEPNTKSYSPIKDGFKVYPLWKKH
jgi:hypothetical protein